MSQQQPVAPMVRALLGDIPYPEHRQREPWQVALSALEEFEACLSMLRLLPTEGQLTNELQARLEMKVEEIRELLIEG